MRLIITLGLAAGLLSACGDSQTYESEDGSMTVTTDDEGNTDATVTASDGSITEFRAGTGDADMPEGYSLPAGTTVSQSTSFNGAQGTGVMLNLESSMSSEELANHFRGQAEAAGVTIDTDARTGEDFAVMGSTADGGSFNFQSAGDGDGSTGMLVVSE